MKKLLFFWLFFLVSATAMWGQVPFTISVVQNPDCGQCNGIVVMSIQSLDVTNPTVGNVFSPTGWENDGVNTLLTWGGLCNWPGYDFINVTIGGIPYGQTFDFGGTTALQVSVSTSLATCQPGDYTDVSVGGGVAPYTYQYSQNGIVVAADQLLAGPITVTVTDANGCSGTGWATIDYAYTEVVNLTACAGGTVNYMGFDYPPGSATFASGGQAPDGCPMMTTVVVATAMQDLYVQSYAIDCATIHYEVFNAPVGATYLWISQFGLPIFSDPTLPNVLGGFMQGFGDYTVQVTDASGCTATASSQWTPVPQLNVLITETGICGDSITVSINDPLQIISGVQWSTGSTDLTIPNLPNQSYSCQVWSTSGCNGAGYYWSGNQLGYINTGNCADSATVVLYNPANVAAVWWVSPSGATTYGLSVFPDVTGNYVAHIQTLDGCEKTMETWLTPTPPHQLYHCNNQLVLVVGPEVQPAFINWYNLDAGACTSCFVTDWPTNGSAISYNLIWTVPETGFLIECINYGTIAPSQVPIGCPAIIQGYVFYDDDADCEYLFPEAPRPQAIVTAENEAGAYIAFVQPDGTYSMAVVADTFEVSMTNPSFIEATCNTPQSIEVTEGETENINLGITAIAECPSMQVSISTPLLRRCMLNNYYINYCNQGTATAQNAQITLTLDPLMTLVAASAPYTTLAAGVLQFDIGNVDSWDCGAIQLYVQLSCDAVLGQTLCVDAHITPDTICAPIGGIWDGSQVIVTGECDGDSVRFSIQNIGIGDMAPPPLEYAIIEDQIILMQGLPFQLPSLQSLDISVPANGSTWRIEAEQTPNFPWPSLPSAQVEGCMAGGGSFSVGFINQYPLGDLEPFIDIDCHTVIGSWDPNDKTGFPIGYDEQHYITPETPIEYLIRFQNTGTDTAFRVVIRDTLSDLLDINTLHLAAASHPNKVELLGHNLLQITFDPIALPDSNANELASHGFFSFIITPKATAPLGSQIFNTSNIYFDYNEAVVTNTTMHTLQRNFVTVTDVVQIPDAAKFSVYPNPTSGLLNIKTDQAATYQIRITDLLGRTAVTADMNGTNLALDVSSLQAGFYLLEAVGQNGTIYTAKLTVK